MRKTLIVGATSSIAQATARLFAEAGDALFLVARNRDRLQVLARDLCVRGAESVDVEVLDVLDYPSHQPVIETAIHAMQGLDLVLIAHGSLLEQDECECPFDKIHKAFDVNLLSTISLILPLANYFEQRKQGTIAVISSVAGDRGRQGNYVYGSAKGALSIYLQGLRNRLYPCGVEVITIKPGFVDTPMTAEFSKGLLWVCPDRIARGIISAVKNHKDVVYVPGFWRYIMLFVKLIPESIFKRLHL